MPAGGDGGGGGGEFGLRAGAEFMSFAHAGADLHVQALRVLTLEKIEDLAHGQESCEHAVINEELMCSVERSVGRSNAESCAAVGEDDSCLGDEGGGCKLRGGQQRERESGSGC
jgi:hypothetical protein